MINCQDIERNLLELLTGETSPEHLAAFQSHLEKCDSCKQLVNSYKAIFSGESVSPMAEVPASLWRRVQSGVNRFEETERKLPLTERLRNHRLVFALKTAGLVMAVVVGVYVGSLNTVAEANDETVVVDDYSTMFAQSTETTFSGTAYDVAAPEENGK